MKILIFLIIFVVSKVHGQQCGVQKSAHSLVFGGISTAPGEWPWLIPLIMKRNDEFFCASNLISQQHLLTAAHCVHEKQAIRGLSKEELYAYVGRFDLTKSKYEKNSIQEDISKIRIHPAWNPRDTRYDADIAILTLKNRVIFSDIIQPVCLPSSNLQVFGLSGDVVGYGKSESPDKYEVKPRKVKIKSFTNDDCFFSDYRFARFGSPRTFCAGERGKTPCQGDSGSGFFINERSSFVIGGLVSSALVQECGQSDFTLFTNVAKFVDWIENEVKTSETESNFDSAFNEFDQEPAESSRVVNTDCKFYTSGSVYSCLVKGLNAQNEDIDLQVNTRQHKGGRTNRDVSFVQIQNGNVQNFPVLSQPVSIFPNLVGFGIIFANLKNIDRSKLKNLNKLKYFLISDNAIEEIPSDTFLDLTQLELIDICRNKIKTLDTNWLEKMPRLRIFKARSNKFEVIPANMFKNNRELEEILFDYNEIKKNEVNFTELRNLKILRILQNSCIDAEYCKEDSNPKCIRSLQQFSYILNGYCGTFDS